MAPSMQRRVVDAAAAYWSGCSRKACMPWEMALRVVSLPATASSRKNRLKSISRQRLAVDLGARAAR